MKRHPQPKGQLKYTYLTKGEQKAFLKSDQKKPKCYSCTYTKDTIWQMFVTDEEGNKFHTCPVCLDLHTDIPATEYNLDYGLLGDDGECIIDFSLRQECKKIKAKRCKECDEFFMTYGPNKYCHSNCEDLAEKKIKK